MNPPTPYYYPLFKRMVKKHTLYLTDSEMYDIVRVCEKLKRKKRKAK